MPSKKTVAAKGKGKGSLILRQAWFQKNSENSLHFLSLLWAELLASLTTVWLRLSADTEYL